ncbi:FHA domain-containing protein [archaeon]|jgi:hypothetical protein|nr:FHA domain-containing protein [archaeon]MBT6698502.1 FHA domain-containing protein [archaeon]
MTNKLTLRREFTDQVINLTGNTELGRSHSPLGEWLRSDRPIPAIYSSLETRIVVEGSKLVSGNHAGIIQDNAGNFYLQDLRSKNGTTLNGRRIQPEIQYRLHEDDRVRLCDVGYRVSLGEAKNYALLVGAGSDNIGASEGDVKRLSDLLGQRGYIVTSLTGAGATRENVREELTRLQAEVLTDSYFLFSFHGHGGSHGVSIGKKVFSPKELYKRLNKLRARKKAVIIEACKSGVFVEGKGKSAIPQGTLVLTASSATKYADETLIGGKDDSAYTGRLARAIERYLGSHAGSFDLRDIYRHIQEGDPELYETLKLQDPQMAGDSFSVPSLEGTGGVSVIHSFIGDPREV